MKKVVFSLLALSGVLVYSQNNTSMMSQEMRDEIKNEVKAEIKDELRAEIKAELKDDLVKEAQASLSKGDFMTRAKNLLSSRIKLSGKSTIRLVEMDYNQQPVSGRVDDRYWSRYNFALNVDAKLTNQFSVHGRIRTGHKQYSFINFGGNADERFNIILDQFWLDWKKGNYSARLGRQSAGSIWTNQIGSQFDVPTHDGISTSATYDLGGIKVQPQLAYFDEQYRDNSSLEEHGKIYGGSITASNSNENLAWKLQVGTIAANHLPNRYSNDLAQRNTDDGGTRYHDGDLAQDYHLWTNYGALTFKNLKDLTFEANFYKNLSNYDVNPQSHSIVDQNGATNQDAGYNEATAPDFTDQNVGFVGGISVGNDSKPKGYKIGARYLYMEKYAAMDYFAQYDATRWASSNIKGPEFSASYRLNKFMQFKSRLFLMDQIKGEDGQNPDEVRTGNRFRFDININF